MPVAKERGAYLLRVEPVSHTEQAKWVLSPIPREPLLQGIVPILPVSLL